MGQYKHRVFVCRSGMTYSTQGSAPVHNLDGDLMGGRVVEDYRNHAPPGGNKDV